MYYNTFNNLTSFKHKLQMENYEAAIVCSKKLLITVVCKTAVEIEVEFACIAYITRRS